ncbi:MAG: EAL domain-containing protein [Lachnospiraceae bacterium]|nr:EAL domain-containing protein [Lachnospiraceae bacterium]
MFINKLNQLYKPERTLYYMEATPEQIRDFYKGNIPEQIAGYTRAYGTYDLPGVFFLSHPKQQVIGIEFRPGDDQADYPRDLKSLSLSGAFYYSVEIDEEIELTRDSVRSLFETIAKEDNAHRTYSDLAIESDPEVIAIFPDGNKIRLLHEWKLVEDRAQYVIRDEVEAFDKDYLYRMAFFDPITGHYNWNHLVSFLEMPIDHAIKDYAFVHFDIKEFKVINEVYGHIAANRVLHNVVDAMNAADFVYTSARCHNDNFAMMIKDMPEAETIRTLTDFFEGLSHLSEDAGYKISYRCGVVPMHRSVLSGNRVADAGKMAQALGNNRNGTEITVYSDKMHDDLSWGNFIKAYVETAIREDEFCVYLQPKFDIRTNTVKGSEALIRWNYKKKEFLPPYRFIPFFEKDGSIGKIDDVVLEKVCTALAKWKEGGLPLYPVSVNLSRKRLSDENLADHLMAIVDSHGISHELIDFELTESATYDNTEQLICLLEDLRRRGFKISMDDFGTGYSSLSLLTQMPLDTLKIDKSFVDHVSTQSEKKEDITVIRHIISLAKELGFTCLAEGAESREQVDRLYELGCEIIQGYYYSKPIPMDEYERKYLLTNGGG